MPSFDTFPFIQCHHVCGLASGGGFRNDSSSDTSAAAARANAPAANVKIAFLLMGVLYQTPVRVSSTLQASEQGPFWQPPGHAITSRKFTGIFPAAYSFTIAHVLRSMPLICFASSLKPGIFDVAYVSTASVTPQLRA